MEKIDGRKSFACMIFELDRNCSSYGLAVQNLVTIVPEFALFWGKVLSDRHRRRRIFDRAHQGTTTDLKQAHDGFIINEHLNRRISTYLFHQLKSFTVEGILKFIVHDP